MAGRLAVSENEEEEEEGRDGARRLAAMRKAKKCPDRRTKKRSPN